MNYHKIEKTSIANGTGIRVVLWCSGCRIHCYNCHNKETWDVNSGKPFDEDAKKELFKALDKSYIQGITFSGGHPLVKENISEIYGLIKEIKEKFPTKDIWLYTGYTLEANDFIPNEDMMTRILSQCNIVVDGPYIEELRDITLSFRGSSNQRLIDAVKTLNEGQIVLYHS